VAGGSTVGKATRGYDAGKRIHGRQRHLVVDTPGHVDRRAGDGGRCAAPRRRIRVLDRAKMAMPSLVLVLVLALVLIHLVLVWLADTACSRGAQDFPHGALRIAGQVVAKLVDQQGFVPLPRRGVVERTHAWITGHRRMSRATDACPPTPSDGQVGRDRADDPPAHAC
jgi:hypothetical protein